MYSLLFADDTTLLACHKDIEILCKFVNDEFQKVTRFFRANTLSLHPAKTKFLVFSHSHEISSRPLQICIDNNDVLPTSNSYNPTLVYPIIQVTISSEVPAIKFLGVFIDPNLNFKFHINFISKKISSALFFICQAKNTLPSKALTALYYSIIHCHLVYALPIWSCTSASNLKTIITKQKIAIRLISNSPYNEHTEPIFKRLNILPFSSLINRSFRSSIYAAIRTGLSSIIAHQ